MKKETHQPDERLPEGFEDLEPFLDHWCTRTSHERWIIRANTPYRQLVDFYETMHDRAEEATKYLEQFPLHEMSEPANNLFQLLLSMCHAAVGVEIHQSSHIRNAPEKHSLKITTGFQPNG